MDPNSSRILLGAAGAGVPEEYWIATLDDTSSDEERGMGIAVDSTGNVYMAGKKQTNRRQMLVKYDKSGVIQWQRGLYQSSYGNGLGVAVDSSNYVYMTGTTYDSGGHATIAKYSSAGTLQWQRKINVSSLGDFYPVAIDDSDNIFVGGTTWKTNGWNSVLQLVKYDTSGNASFIFGLGNNWLDAGTGLRVGKDGYIYVSGFYSNPSNGNRPLIYVIKYSTSGGIQWQKTYGRSDGNSSYKADADADSSGNVYVVGGLYNSDSTRTTLTKLNSSGNRVWQKSFNGFYIGVTYLESVCVDIDGNIYVVGSDYVSSYYIGFIIKFDSSGNILWQRTLSRSGQHLRLSYVAFKKSGSIYACGMLNETKMILFKLPDDGSLTGYYNGITYASSSYSTSDINYPTSTRNSGNLLYQPSSTAASMTSTTTNFTSSTTTL